MIIQPKQTLASTRVNPFQFDLDELRCYIQLSGVIAEERNLHSAQSTGFNSNQGFKIFHRTTLIHEHHTESSRVQLNSSLV